MFCFRFVNMVCTCFQYGILHCFSHFSPQNCNRHFSLRSMIINLFYCLQNINIMQNTYVPKKIMFHCACALPWKINYLPQECLYTSVPSSYELGRPFYDLNPGIPLSLSPLGSERTFVNRLGT